MKIKLLFNSALVVLLSACQGGVVDSKHNEISVASEPSGASVYVMGELQGVTPMTVNVTKLYPVTYSKENASLYGYIVLKREGCSDRSVKVKHGIGSAGMKEKLECEADEATAVEPAAIKASVISDKPVKQRLQELQTLKNDGLINEDEYQEVRSRILESL
ncbi:PEGA domain-containing protein [Pseudomonadota bacterium]